MRNTSTNNQATKSHRLNQTASPHRIGRVLQRKSNQSNNCLNSRVPLWERRVNRRPQKKFVFKSIRNQMNNSALEAKKAQREKAIESARRPRTAFNFTGTAFSVFHPLDTSLLGDFDQSGSMEPFMDAHTLERLLEPTK